SLTVPLDPRKGVRFDHDALGLHQSVDAWELFALRALLLALHARTEEAVSALERDLSKPLWETLLDELAARRSCAAEARTWAFSLVAGFRGHYTLAVHARGTRADGRPGPWRKQTFEALFGEDATPLEREIARVALSSLERPADARVDLA